MNEFLKNTASLTAAEITTNKFYLEGEEVGDAMLPKLVKRASLTPVVEDGIVKENIYYTLHNDAGTCLYTSPHMRYEEDEKVTSLFPSRNPKRWYWMTVGAGTSKRKGGKRKKKGVKLYKINIDHEYDAFINPKYKALHYVPKQSLRLWKAQTVESARYAFAETGLYYCATNFQKLTDATAMFVNCEELTKFTSKNFRSCIDTSLMFRDCIKLDYLGIDTQTAFTNVVYAAEMFRNCGILPTASLIMDKVETTEGMFRGCVMLSSVAGSSFKSVSDMTSMFDGCVSLSAIDKDCLGASVIYADYAFYDCQALTYSPCDDFKLLESAKAMFYNSGLSGTLSIKCIELTEATSMFQKCKNLTSIISATNFKKVINGKQMFAQCTGLTSADVNFPELEDGTNMFNGCSSLTTLTNVTFPKLKTGLGMFGGCRLDAASAELIIDAVKKTQGMPESYNGMTNGMVIGCDSSLKSNSAWRTSIGLPATYTSDDEEVITVNVSSPASGYPSTILVRFTWN